MLEELIILLKIIIETITPAALQRILAITSVNSNLRLLLSKKLICFSEKNLLSAKASTVELLIEKKAVFNPKK